MRLLITLGERAETHETVRSEFGYAVPISHGPTTSRSRVTLTVTLSRRRAAASEHELGEKAGGC